MYTVFDTETTGMLNKNVPRHHPTQPHICQIAGIFLDENFNEVHLFKFLIKPNGWVIPAEATAIHGITTEQCELYGIPLNVALLTLIRLMERSKVLVAHNLDYDVLVVEGEMLRMGKVFTVNCKSFCTMKAFTPILQLPSPWRKGEYKWPKLAEVYQHCLGEELVDAHDALGDVRATAKILQWYHKCEAPIPT